MRIALVDDDADFLAQSARTLALLLEERGMRSEVKRFASADGLQAAMADPFDMYFLDVFMDGTGGIELARQIRRKQPDAPIIFFTTSKEHSLEAYSVHAVDYVVKPFTKETFAAALDHALRQLTLVRPLELVLKGGQGIVRLPVSDIVLVEADGHYQSIHTVGGRSRKFCMPLQDVWEQLEGDVRFVRVGRQSIVNLSHVSAIGSRSLEMSNGTSVPVPRRIFQDVKTAFMRFF